METSEDFLIYKGEMKTKIWDFQVKIDNLSYKITERGLEVLNKKEEEFGKKDKSKYI